MESAGKINEEMVNRLRLSDLPDELILKIFSMLPNFKESDATRVLSKQHEDPYKLVPDVTFKDNDEESLVTFMSFIYGSLLSHDDQNLERLHLKLVRKYSASGINFWIQVAVNRSVRKLRFDLFGGTLDLPSCLSNSTTLKSLILRDVTINRFPRGFCLPSLKSLHLFSVDFSQKASITRLLQTCPDLEYLVLQNYGWNFCKARFCLSSLKSLHLLSAVYHNRFSSLSRLLQSCPVLENLVLSGTMPPPSCFSSNKSLHPLSFKLLNGEDLFISRTRDGTVRLFSINVPTLKNLTINNSTRKRSFKGFWINAPALQTLNIKDTVSNILVLEFMPELTKANIEVICHQPAEKFIGSLTSIRHLSLCSPTFEIPYRSGSIFPYLEHLELCTCSERWANLFSSILNNAPSLQSLKLKSNKKSVPYSDSINFWDEPAVVPKCFLTHLEIFEWRQYENTVQQRIVAAYILANATCLKMATFSTRSRHKVNRMVMKLKKLNRLSQTCQLVFE